MGAPFGATPPGPSRYVGGGNLWSEPIPKETWVDRFPWGALSMFFVALAFALVALSIWLQAAGAEGKL